jgi:dTDP-4-dehydrorhamnose 3,5-epimerase
VSIRRLNILLRILVDVDAKFISRIAQNLYGSRLLNRAERKRPVLSGYLYMNAIATSRPLDIVRRTAPDLPRVIAPKRHIDNRGWFSESFHEKRLRDAGIMCHFVQDNRSNSKTAGTLRGLHFQLPPAAQAKLIGVSRGRILDIAVDVRCGSPTYGSFVSAILSAENGRQLYVPVGFAHGFCTLEKDVEVMYKVSDYYAPAHDGGIRWNDPDIGIPWPFNAAEIVTSEKDGSLPLLKEFVSPFAYDGYPLEPLPLT